METELIDMQESSENSTPRGIINRLDPRWWVALLAGAFVLLIGLLGAIGLVSGFPRLYTWSESGIAMDLRSILSLLLLSSGYLTYIFSENSDRSLTIFVSLCFTLALAFGLWEVIAYLMADPRLSLEQFLIPSSPVDGHISFYAALGLSFAGFASLLLPACFNKTRAQWWVQGISILLVNLAVFGFAVHLGPVPAFRYLCSIPFSLGLFAYGLALLFFPLKRLQLVSPFFTAPPTQIYTFLLCGVWLFIIAWQTIWGNAVFTTVHLPSDPIHSLVLWDELDEIFVSTMILGLGLHILGTLQERDTLAKALQETFNSVAMLATTLGHDLKGPIKTQINAIDMVLARQFGDSISSPENHELLTAIQENNHFELELVLNLIDLLRYKVKEEAFKPKAFLIKPFLEEIRTELEPWTLRKQQSLRIDIDLQSDLMILADPFGLKRVLHNLLNNAIQHLDAQNHITVGVQIKANEALFSVQDDGPGIPPEKQLQLFNRFTRISSSGLGLYITRQIVERHGGSIWVESIPGQGSTFYFKLPQPRTLYSDVPSLSRVH